MAVVIDKAMQWKEMTMKAKWLWTTWTYLMVVGIIVLEILFCFFSLIYFLPKIKKLQHDGFLKVCPDVICFLLEEQEVRRRLRVSHDAQQGALRRRVCTSVLRA